MEDGVVDIIVGVIVIAIGAAAIAAIDVSGVSSSLDDVIDANCVDPGVEIIEIVVGAAATGAICGSGIPPSFVDDIAGSATGIAPICPGVGISCICGTASRAAK